MSPSPTSTSTSPTTSTDSNKSRLSLRERTFLQGGLQSTRDVVVPEFVEPVTDRHRAAGFIPAGSGESPSRSEFPFDVQTREAPATDQIVIRDRVRRWTRSRWVDTGGVGSAPEKIC